MRKYVTGAAAALAGIVCGVIIFFPWKTAADTAADLAVGFAAENGIFLTISSSEVDGIFSKRFSYGGVAADFPVFRLALREASFTPSMISSLLSRKLKCRIETGRGSLVPVTRQSLEWDSGSARLTLSGGGAMLDDIALVGKTSLTGRAELSSDGSLMRAELLLRTSPEMDRALELAKSLGVVRLTKIKEGEWRIQK